MSLVRFSQTPWFDRFFDNSDFMDLSNKNFSKTNTTLPSVNVKEDENQFLIEVAAPGFEKIDFKIELHNDVLSISSEKEEKNEKKDDKGIYTKREFSYQSFKRSFTLPTIADVENVSANYDKGILFVIIPKKEEAKPKSPRAIEIN